MENLNWFKDNDIPFHAQIVLCPDINDGKELQRTLEDLTSLGEALLSVAIVPVGITQFREGNILKEVTSNIAQETIQIASKYHKVCCSDEFFLLANKEIPSTEYYGNFSQLDDGVGAIRALLDDFDSYKLPNSLHKNLNLAFAVSYAGFDALNYVSKKLNNIDNLNSIVLPVKSKYWGKNITVAGLITSQDLIETIDNVECDYVVVPGVMLKPYSDMFLDGETLSNVEKLTKKKFLVIQNQYSLKELIDFINNYNIQG